MAIGSPVLLGFLPLCLLLLWLNPWSTQNIFPQLEHLHSEVTLLIQQQEMKINDDRLIKEMKGKWAMTSSIVKQKRILTVIGVPMLQVADDIQTLRDDFNDEIDKLEIIRKEVKRSELDINYQPDGDAVQLKKALSGLVGMDECGYTHLRCKQYVIHLGSGIAQLTVLGHWYFLPDIDAFSLALIDILQIKPVLQVIASRDKQAMIKYSTSHNIIRQLMDAINSMNTLHELRVGLDYLISLRQYSYYEMGEVSQWLECAREVIAGGRECLKVGVQVDLLEDSAVGLIDTFPFEYKIGVYLPLVLLSIYPLVAYVVGP